MNFGGVDSTAQQPPHQFPFEDPMGLTVNIINTAEAALREMSNSKNKNGQLQLQPQPIYPNQLYYGHPSATATVGGAALPRPPPQPLYYNLNIIESPHPHIQQQQQGLGQSIAVNYAEASGHVQQQLPPPPPPVVLSEGGCGSTGAVKAPKNSSNGNKKKKKEGATKKPKKKTLKKGKDQGRKYVCRFCTAGFTTQEYLGSHMNTVHIDKLKFQCSHCAKRFARSDQKNRHEAIHNPNRFQDKLKYPCRHCTKKFARSDQRKRHEGIHDPNRFQGEAKFSCEFCDKKYHLKGSLDGHRKRQHLGYVWKRKPKKSAAVV